MHYALGCRSLKLVSSVCLPARLFVRISKAAQNVYSTTHSHWSRGCYGNGAVCFIQNKQVEER